RHTVGQETAGIVSARVSALAQGMSRTMAGTKIKIATFIILAVSAVALGLIAGTQCEAAAQIAATKQPPKAGSPQALHAAKPAAKPGSDETIELKGRVLGPDGKAVAGAKICLTTNKVTKKEDLTPRATTDTDGRFHFTATRAELECDAKIVANASGYGLD